MATEAGRHELHEKISTEWGQEHAEELMSYLPPVGWADVATKHDLEKLALRLEARIDRSIRWIVGIMIAMTGVFGFIVSIVR